MKKTYRTPLIRTIYIAAEGLIAQSDAKMNFTSTTKASHTPEGDEVLSNGRQGGSIWEDD